MNATTDSLTQFGVSGMFAHWPVYGLAVAGLLAEILNQAARLVGRLACPSLQRQRRSRRVHRAEPVDLQGDLPPERGASGHRCGGVRHDVGAVVVL